MIIVLLLALLGVPLFALYALAALNGYRQAELEPGLAIMNFLELGSLEVLLIVPLLSVAVALPGPAFRRGVIERLPITRGRPRVRAGWVTFPWLAVWVCGLALAAALPASVLFATASMMSSVPTISLEQLVGLMTVPATLAVVLVVLWPGGIVGFPGTERTGAGEPARIAWAAPMPVLVLGAVGAGWLDVLEASLLAFWWMAIGAFVVLEVPLRTMARRATIALARSGGLLLLFGLSLAWVAIWRDAGSAESMSEMLQPWLGGPIRLAMLIVMAGVVAGAAFGVLVGMVLLAPVVLVTIHGLGMDPLWPAMVLMLALTAGSILIHTPGGAVPSAAGGVRE